MPTNGPEPGPPRTDPKPLLRAIAAYDSADRAREQVTNVVGANLSKTRAIYAQMFAGEARQIAERMITVEFAFNLTAAEIRSWIARDPARVERVVADAIGKTTQSVARRAALKLMVDVESIGGMGIRAELQRVTINRVSDQYLSNRIIFRLPELRTIAKSIAQSVAKSMLRKLPLTELDGPIPAADIIFFASGAYDIYSASKAARRELKLAVFTIMLRTDLEMLDAGIAIGRQRVAGADRSKRATNCAALTAAYRANPSPDLVRDVTKRCPQ